MRVWDWLVPPVPTLPPLQPQISAWADDSHLYDVVLDDLGIDAAAVPLGRRGAMRVPAVARARNLTCGAVAALPLVALRLDTPVTPQPYFLHGTDGQTGDLTATQMRAWRVGPQTPYWRMLWTVDDLFFHGESLWVVTRFTDHADGRRLPLRAVRVPYDHWTTDDGRIVDLDNNPFPEDRLIYIPGAHEGVLDYGRQTMLTAARLEANAAEVACHPLRLELHQTSAAELTPAERAEVVRETRAALRDPDGILFTNSAVETIEHRMDSDALQLGARNGSALDVARLANMPAAMLDATTQGASLEYATLQGRNQQWLDYGLSLYTDPIASRLSMDDVVPVGQRTAFDTAQWTTATPTPTGAPSRTDRSTMTTYRLTLNAPAATVEATDTDARRLAGIAVPYGVIGHTSAGPLTIDAGAIRVPEHLRSVKLFREHGRLLPVGYAVEATDTPDALRMAFHVAATPDGDLSLVEAAEGVRDSLSVELSNVTVEAGHVTAADLVGVAQVAVPAFAGALLAAEDHAPTINAALTDAEQADVHALAQELVDATAPTSKSPDDDDQPADADTAPPTEGARQMEASHPVGMVPASDPRPTPAADLSVFAAAAASAFTGARDAAAVNAALADIVPPAAGTANPMMPPAFLGRLWQPRSVERPLATAFGSKPLTSMTWAGWRFSEYPEVDDYAGRKAEIPTGPVGITPVTGEAKRIAGGWDFDRIYEDFNTGFIEAFLDAATVSYGLKSEADLATATLAAAPAVSGSPFASLTAALVALAQALTASGASPSFFACAPNVFGKFLGLSRDEVPWWLPTQGSVDIASGVSVANVRVIPVLDMPAGTVFAADRNAVDFRETGPIKVRAIDLPHGGIDAAIFGYQGIIVTSTLGLAKATVTVTPLTAADEPSPAPEGFAVYDPSGATVAEVLAHADTLTDPQAVEDLHELEKYGKHRATLLAGLEQRRAQLLRDRDDQDDDDRGDG